MFIDNEDNLKLNNARIIPRIFDVDEKQFKLYWYDFRKLQSKYFKDEELLNELYLNDQVIVKLNDMISTVYELNYHRQTDQYIWKWCYEIDNTPKPPKQIKNKKKIKTV